MRSIKIDELHLEKKEHIKLKPKEPININPIKNIELDQDQNTFDDIEEMLSKFK